MRERLFRIGAGALAFGLLGAGEAIVLLVSSELRYESPGIETIAQIARYGILGAICGSILTRATQTTPPAQMGRLAFAFGLFLMAGWWVHSALLQNIGLFQIVSLLWSAGILIGVCAIFWLTKRITGKLLRNVSLSLIVSALVFSALVFRTESKAAIAFKGKGNLPDITLIVIDTLRADHLSCYGYATPSGEKTSPIIDSLAQEGMLFPVVHAQAPWTRPSMASLHTGLYPSAHQVNRIRDRVPASAVTLAERLHQQGYRTGAFSANAQVSPTFGFAQGFDSFWLSSEQPLVRFSMWGEVVQKINKRILRRNPQAGRDAAALVNAEIKKWVSTTGNQPTFTYIQYIDPHGPYDPPEWLLSSNKPDIRSHLANAKNFQHADPFPFGQRPYVTPSIRAQVVELYDGEIRYVDREIGHLIEFLKGIGKLDATDWLVITSDHGEEFFDHRQWGHGHSLFEEQLHVPLIVLGPGVPPDSRAPHPVSLLDLHPTISAWGNAHCEEEVSGTDLNPLLSGNALENPPPLYAERLLALPMRSIRKGEMKVIEMPDLESGGEPLVLHFDLEKNPEETITMVGPAGDSPLDRTQPAFQIPPLLLKSLRSMQKIADQFSLEGERALLGADVMQALEEMGYVGEDGGRLLDDE